MEKKKKQHTEKTKNIQQTEKLRQVAQVSAETKQQF